MIVEYVRYRVPADRDEEFRAAHVRATEHLGRAEECREFQLTRSLNEPERYILRIVWNSVEAHSEDFRSGPNFEPFLDAVKPFFEAIEEISDYEITDVRGDGGAVPTLYDHLGGAEALEKLTAAFYREVVKDELLEPLFGHMRPEHPHYVALWLGEVFGGPKAYSETRGSYRHMVEQHLGKHIREEQRRRWVNLLMDAADEVGLPDDPEFRAAFASYIEWGTRLAVINSQPGIEAYDADVPRWGWGGHPPYKG